MWFRSQSSSPPACSSPARRRAAFRSRHSRKLLLENLENRSLLAFNVLAEYATGANPTDLALARLDGGNQLDLVVANNSASQGSVRLGNADGTFASPQSTGAISTSVASGDLTGDGITDLAAINDNVIVQKGNGDGTFQQTQAIALPAQLTPAPLDPVPLPQSPKSIATGDLNADGKLDLVVAGQTSFSVYHRVLQCGYYDCGYVGYFSTYTDGYVNVLMGDGSGGFAAPDVYPLGRDRSPSGITMDDLNGDGNADVLVATSSNLSTLLGDGTGDLAPAISAGYGQKSVTLGDFDGDGHLDTIRSIGSVINLQRGQGNGRFVPTADVDVGLDVGSTAVGDVNADGKLDLVVAGTKATCTSSGYGGCYANEYSGQIRVILGDGLGGFSLPAASPLGTDFNGSFVDLALEDITGDGLPDVVAIESSTGLAIVASNDGDWIAPVPLSISSPTVVEGHHGTTNAVFNITLATPSARDVTVDFATADLNATDEYWYGGFTATSGVDYTAAIGTLTIPAGQTSATISVPIIGDRVGEPNELFFLNLSNPTNSILSNNRAVGTITDDEPFISFKYNTFGEVVEGNSDTTSMTFTVELSAPSDAPVTVDFATADGDALAGGDYQAATGTVTIVPGNTTQTFAVQVIGDTRAEFDEYFYVNLSNATNAMIGTGNRAGLILDDDTVPAISISDASINEGNSGTRSMMFTVSLSQPSTERVRVNYNTANGTAKTSDNDYVARSGTITFYPGQTTKTIKITIKGDKKKESDEYFYVKLSGASGAPIEDGQGEGVIFNDDFTATKRGSWYAAACDAALDDFLKPLSKKRGW